MDLETSLVKSKTVIATRRGIKCTYIVILTMVYGSDDGKNNGKLSK